MSLKKTILLLTTLLLSIALFGADGDVNVTNEGYYKVIASGTSGDSVRIFCQNEEGMTILFNISEETEMNIPFDQIENGMVLSIVDNGMMTMSIPPQVHAIRVASAEDQTIEFPPLPEDDDALKGTISELESGGLDLVSLIPRFSYGYGYDTMLSLLDQGLVVRSDYFSRGILDALEARTDILLTVDEIISSVNDYFENAYSEENVTGDKGEETTDFDAIHALTAPISVDEKFSYSYGFMLSSQLVYNGVELSPKEFITGLNDALFGHPEKLTFEERNETAGKYVEAYNQKIEALLKEISEENLSEAETFFEENATKEGMEAIGDYLILERLSNNEGTRPVLEDTVNVDYTLQDLEGNVLDQGEGVEFPLGGVIDGFRDALLNMSVGDSVNAYVHPNAGYGINGAGGIEPNKLLIFNITLNSIVTEDASKNAETDTTSTEA